MIRAMPRCSYGQELYDRWVVCGRIIETLEARRGVPFWSEVRPEIPSDLNYDEEYRKGIEAKNNYLRHEEFCSLCLGSQ